MSRRLLATLAGIAVLAALPAGCGGSDDEDEVLTKAQYVKKGTVVCTKNGKLINGEYGTYSQKQAKDGTKTTSKAAIAEAIEDVILPGFRREVEELQELPSPNGDEDQVEEMLAMFEEGLEEGEKDPEALFGSEASQFVKATKLAEKYGLEGCGTLIG